MTADRSLRPWFRALRPKQWTKNALVASAPVATGQLFESPVLTRTIIAFVIFCAAASATYLMNDAADVVSDRQHPTKRLRPIAAGEISIRSARMVAVALMAFALTGGVALDPRFGAFVALYLGTTWAYSAGLKRVVILDMVLVAAGFAFRAIGGAYATRVAPSWWFVIVVSAGAFLLVAGKRLGEYKSAHGSVSTRSVLAKYSEGALRIACLSGAAMTLLGYVLWALAQSQRVDRQGGLIWLTLVPFALAVARFCQLALRGDSEEPDQLVFKDRVIVGLGVAWLSSYLLAISA